MSGRAGDGSARRANPVADAVAAELAALGKRVATLEAREEVRTLRNRFHEFVNADRWGEIGDLFAEDAVLDYDNLGTATGRVAIGEFFAAIPLRPLRQGGRPVAVRVGDPRHLVLRPARGGLGRLGPSADDPVGPRRDPWPRPRGVRWPPSCGDWQAGPS